MVDSGLINEKPRVTLIQRVDGSVFLIGPKGKKIDLKLEPHYRKFRLKLRSSVGWLE